MPDPNGKSQARLIAVDFLAQVFLALSIGIAASIVLAGVVLLIAAEAQAAATELAPMKPAEARSGAPLFQPNVKGASEEEARKHVVELALTHHLVTKYTSLVAIDRTPARPENAPLKTAALPTNLPEGWSYDAVFGAQGGELPQGATDSRANLLAGAILLLLATFLLLRQRAQRRRGWA